MAGMNDQERRMINAALEDGTLPPHDFSLSQLAWASIIARAKPMGMDMRYFIQKLLKRTRGGKNVPQDKQLCFDSLDFLKHLFHEKQEKVLEWKGIYEEERIRRKRLEQLLKQSEDRHQLRRPGDGVDHATQLSADHQREVDGDVNMGDGIPISKKPLPSRSSLSGGAFVLENHLNFDFLTFCWFPEEIRVPRHVKAVRGSKEFH